MNISHSNILESINSPEDLRALPITDLPQVCSEIRQYLIETLAHNPGHFGSSMGAVEIIVALHYVFNTPEDKIVFDVGHQAYAHKILTGRKALFSKQRTHDGISGFPFPKESQYDTFVCGHAGNSISAALGMAIADSITPNHEDRKTVALIGDASISNGIAFEGLNNAATQPNNLLIILNDNDMSIDNPVGSLHKYLSELTTTASYNKWRLRTYNLFKKFGLINDKGKGILLRFSNSLKSLISAQQNIFEGFNIRYFGPFDGNDVQKVVKVLNDIKEMKGPRILHLHTVKGKGFEAAEKNPQEWHAPGNFNPETGEKIAKNSTTPLWQELFGQNLVNIASKNSNVVGISAAMLSGTSMNKMMEAYPDRTFDVGISEGHAVTFAGGLASTGKHPFVAIYSSFLQRAFDNIIHDTAIQGLPVTYCIDRAGIVGEDGVTHHGLFDISYLRIIPNMVVASPADAYSLEMLMNIAADYKSTMAIRYPRGKAVMQKLSTDVVEFGKGRRILINENAKVAILTIGPIATNAITASEILKGNGIPVDLYDMIWVKPLDEKLLFDVFEKHDLVVTLEDGIKKGGFGSAISEWAQDNNIHKDIVNLGIPDKWIYQGSIAELQKDCGIDPDSIADIVKQKLISGN